MYGYAGGDPINLSDPFGLSPDTAEVGCRKLEGVAGTVGNHCAVRVRSADTTWAGELLNQDGTNAIVSVDPNDSRYSWKRLPTPAGMSQEQFEANLARAFRNIGNAFGGGSYSSHGATNSNFFIWSVVHGAGGSMPRSAVPSRGFTPGICGGDPNRRFSPGARCH